MLRNRHIRITAALAAALFLYLPLSLSGQGLPVREFPPFRADAAYAQANSLIAEGFFDEGREQLLQIAAANPNTTLGATSLFRAAMYAASKPEAIAILQRIIAEYPQSRFELQARHAVTSKQATSKEQWLQVASALVSSYGAPTAQEIVQNPIQAGVKYRALPREYQRALIQHYYFVTNNLRSQDRRSEAFEVALFGMDVVTLVEPSCYASFGNQASNIMTELNGQHSTPWPPLDPEVRVRHSGGAGPRPRIRLEARQRVAFSHPISLGKATFQLDGRDVKSDVQVVKHTINLHPSKKRDFFERLRLAYRPGQNLSPGPHVFTATIPVSNTQGVGKGTAQVTIQLRVRKSHDDDDECERRDEDAWDDDWGRH